NHASWYVQSVLLRAKLIGGLPPKLVDSLTTLVEGHFPVAAPAKYADNAVEKLAQQPVKSSNAAVPVASDPNSTKVSIFAKEGSPVIAVNDGKIVAVGQNQQFGKYIELQDATGNIYTYAQLGSIPTLYPVPKPVKVSAAQIAKELSVPTTPKPTAPATAGSQQAPPTVSAAKATKEAKAAPPSLPVTPQPASTSIPAPMAKERLFADPSRPASYAAGGATQIKRSAPEITSFQNYFSDVLHLGKNQYTLQPLKPGAIVVAGTILGRIAAGNQTTASHVDFLIRPAGKDAPYIDPKPILDGWKLLEATAVYRAAGVNPFFGPGAKNPTIGQILLMSKQQLTNRVLADPHVQIYACGRRDIQAELIDRRILATIEFLSGSGLDPTISGLQCGHSPTGSTGVDAAGATGSSVDISAINNIPVLGHQGSGSITDVTIRRLLTLQGVMKPDDIVSLMSYKGQSNTLAVPDHANRIQVSYTPLYGQNKKLSNEIKSILQPGQWIQLINRISQIPEPIVPIAPSQYAIKTSTPGQ
ncbi:MAG: M23 family metallopeptidase, partial [Solirubrobacterales bacterium]|nr:M23 family metallopeptidase [Solirubrobacterales bacterium]